MLKENTAANTGVQDVSTSEGPATPMKINLQLFAEGDPVGDPTPSNEPAPVQSNEPSSTPIPNDPTPGNQVPNNETVLNPQPSNEPTQTQAFARRLKEETQRAIDAEYSQLYGEQYGIHTKADFDRAIAEQQAAEQAQKMNIDPAFYNEFLGLKDKLGQYEAKEQQLERTRMELEQDTSLKNDPNTKDLYTQWEKEIKENAKTFNCDLETAFTLKVRQSIGDILKGEATKAEQTAVQKMLNNGQSTPGSLSQGVGDSKLNPATMPKTDFNSLLDRVRRGEKVQL